MAAAVADEQSLDASASAATIAVAITLAVGDFVEAFVTNDSGTADSITVSGVTASDGSGHNLTMSQVEHINETTDNQSNTSFASTQVAVAGSYTITATYSVSCAFRGIRVKRISGSSGLDVHTSGVSNFAGTGTDAVTTGTVTPSAPGALLSAHCSCTHGGGPTITKGTGFTVGAGTVPYWATVGPANSESLHVSTTSAVAATFTSSANNIFELIAHLWLDAVAFVPNKVVENAQMAAALVN